MTPLQKSFYDEIVLSEEEKEEALFEGRKAKYFRIKNADKWPSHFFPRFQVLNRVRYLRSTSLPLADLFSIGLWLSEGRIAAALRSSRLHEAHLPFLSVLVDPQSQIMAKMVCPIEYRKKSNIV